jgi:hypothetical protein
MKNYTIFLSALLLSAITGCTNTDYLDVNVNNKIERQLNSDYTTIVSESGVNAIAQNPLGKTWRDIDSIYRREKGKFDNPKDLQMFRSKMLHHLVSDFHITQEQDEAVLPVLAFWVKEMEAMQTVNPQFAYLILSRLNDFLADDEIKKYAENYYLKANSWKEKNVNQANLESGGNILDGAFKEDIQVFFKEHERGLKNLETLIQSKN